MSVREIRARERLTLASRQAGIQVLVDEGSILDVDGCSEGMNIRFLQRTQVLGSGRNRRNPVVQTSQTKGSVCWLKLKVSTQHHKLSVLSAIS